MKALQRDFFREIKKNKGRFISVFFIVMLGAAFFSGIRSSKFDMELSSESYYDKKNLMDIKVISTAGLTDDDIEDISKVSEVEKIFPSYSKEVLNKENNKEQVVNLIGYTEGINEPTVMEGRLPKKEDECFVDTEYLEKSGRKIGDEITFYSGTDEEISNSLKYDTYKIVGSGNLPQYMDFTRGIGSIGDGSIDSFVVVMPEVFKQEIYTEAYIKVKGAKELDSFDDSYKNKVDSVEEKLKDISNDAVQRRYDEIYNQLISSMGYDTNLVTDIPKVEKPQWYITDRNDISSVASFNTDAERIENIGKVFPVIFFLVAALVSLTAMTRMVEEQRQQIGILKALGCSNSTIAMRYFAYAMIPTVLGSVIGVVIGEKLLPFVIMDAYSIMYTGLTDYVIPLNWEQGIFAIVVNVLCNGVATLAACGKEFKAKPSELMRPQAPKGGKRVFLEKINFLWSRISFTGKSTIRNLFRYKKRFFMTVIGIGGCMGLILVGLGLHDSITFVAKNQFKEFTKYNAVVAIDAEGSDEIMSEINNYDGVKETFKIYSQNIELKGKEKSIDATINVPSDYTDIEDYFIFRNRKTKEKYNFPKDGAAISEKTAKMLNVSVGDTVEIKSGEELVKVPIKCIYENYLGHYIFISESQYNTLYKKSPTYNQILVNYDDTSEKFEESLGKKFIKLEGVKGVSFTSDIVKSIDDMLGSLNLVVYILVLSAGLLAFVVLYNLNNINIAERQRELATLKVLGFYDKEVSSYVYRENIILTIIGIIVGFLIGSLLHQYVIQCAEVDTIMFGRSIRLISYIISGILTFIFSIIVNLVMSGKLKNIDMIESLKSVE